MTRKTKWMIAAGLAVAVVGGSMGGSAWILPEANPPLRYTGVIITPRADDLLRRGCFDCHSNETRWPVYTYIPPFSVLIARHVAKGRKDLNFSKWEGKTAKNKAHKIRESYNLLVKKKMPLKTYSWLHPDASFSEAEMGMLKQDIVAVYGEKAVAPFKKKKKKKPAVKPGT
ncbi:MAG: heme-binding domain-containing protein [Deltaproteobacteria bacterium]|nr:heme-binding domain-containing protein [Deltaproteobacteria bacterium]